MHTLCKQGSFVLCIGYIYLSNAEIKRVWSFYLHLSGMHGGMNFTLHTRQSSTQNSKYQVSYKHSCFSRWWAHSRPKQVENDKYTKKKLCTKLALFTRLYRDAWSTKHKSVVSCVQSKFRAYFFKGSMYYLE
jgi:hypothetical protein